MNPIEIIFRSKSSFLATGGIDYWLPAQKNHFGHFFQIRPNPECPDFGPNLIQKILFDSKQIIWDLIQKELFDAKRQNNSFPFDSKIRIWAKSEIPTID